MNTLKRILFFTCLLSLFFSKKQLYPQQAQFNDNHIYVSTAWLTGQASASNKSDHNSIFPDFISVNSKALELGYKMDRLKIGLAGVWGSGDSSQAVYQKMLTNYWNLSVILGLNSYTEIGKVILEADAKIGPGILRYSRKKTNSSSIETNHYASIFLGLTGTVGFKINNMAITLTPAADMIYCKNVLTYSYGGGIGLKFYL
ncbi:hypothetical protein [Fodinibius halophilus]|uniref:Uncharacterized protein n=1 Tax=Fodinibius halophilus TaxID=1736908 RepID=A0A6M1T5L4_9BACT|nr:hypothetical protein [Fodinibius halophilus]NGP89387.1 hypothetical protein [Fodinibius halophilus]